MHFNRQLDIDPGVVASQITLLEHWLFQKIPGLLDFNGGFFDNDF